jgi:hypothetical protein
MSQTVENTATVDVVIMIGNSDDKLTQVGWSEFTDEVFDAVESFASVGEVRGIWFSEGASLYQNAAICASVPQVNVKALRDHLRELCGRFKQESIAVLVGTTEFVKAPA